MDWGLASQLLFAIIAVVGNSLVVFIVCSNRQMRQEHSPYWLILSLSVADFLVGAFNILNTTVCSVHPLICASWRNRAVFTVIKETSFSASTTTLCLLTLDRYLAVVHPYFYKRFMHNTRCLLLIMGSWCLGLAMIVPRNLYRLRVIERGKSEAEICFMLIFSFLILFMIYAYTRILIVIRRHRKVINVQSQIANQITSQVTNQRPNDEESNTTDTKTRDTLKARHAGLVSVAIVVGIFLTSNVVDISYFICKQASSCHPSHTFQDITDIIRYGNSAANFFAYALVKGGFKERLKTLLLCKRS
ncbi:5-hydroxytryptamine receptor 6-like [Nematostella vectensis]|uniref:5-hydroxytryptamine receptor 6-like n=1 Tax=Nematostella vectensis TaxID=45351 RepID=UPI0020775E5D|nr:5-hydroxytryptamine receptor 6-like [Nematostella vectensis]